MAWTYAAVDAHAGAYVQCFQVLSVLGLLAQRVTYFYIQLCCSSVAALLQLVYWYKALLTFIYRAVAALLQLCCSWFTGTKRYVLYEYKHSCCSSVAALLQLVC
jgi:hypothetical protein